MKFEVARPYKVQLDVSVPFQHELPRRAASRNGSAEQSVSLNREILNAVSPDLVEILLGSFFLLALSSTGLILIPGIAEPAGLCLLLYFVILTGFAFDTRLLINTHLV